MWKVTGDFFAWTPSIAIICTKKHPFTITAKFTAGLRSQSKSDLQAMICPSWSILTFHKVNFNAQLFISWANLLPPWLWANQSWQILPKKSPSAHKTKPGCKHLLWITAFSTFVTRMPCFGRAKLLKQLLFTGNFDFEIFWSQHNSRNVEIAGMECIFVMPWKGKSVFCWTVHGFVCRSPKDVFWLDMWYLFGVGS